LCNDDMLYICIISNKSDLIQAIRVSYNTYFIELVKMPHYFANSLMKISSFNVKFPNKLFVENLAT
jgi:hypothetical protein